MQIIRKIYNEKQFKFLKGKEAEEFWKRLQLPGRIESGDLSTSLLDAYQKALSKFLEEAKVLKNKIYSTFSSEKEERPEFTRLDTNSAVLSTPQQTKLEFTTKSILNKLKSEQLCFLKDILNNPVKIDKIFTAS